MASSDEGNVQTNRQLADFRKSTIARVLVLLLTILLGSCAPAPFDRLDDRPRPLPLEDDLGRLLEGTLSPSSDVPGAMLRVRSDSIGMVWEGATGVADRDAGTPLRPEQPLRIASITKTFVAAAILRLVEEGGVDLDAPISRYVLPSSEALLETDGYDVDEITVRMLLQHTSGLWDYADAEAYLEQVRADPGQRWTRAEQLRFAVAEGDPVGDPGQIFHYSDTGYILLGEILEEVTGRPMNEAVHELLSLRALGIENTWFESQDPRPESAPPRAHQYVDGLDGHIIHPSVDLYGGGGLVSTLEDLTEFYRALLGGEVFEDPEILESMLTVTPQSVSETGDGYGMGIAREVMAGVVCYGHGGYWGIVVRHCPALDLTVVAAVTSTAGSTELRSLLEGAVRLGAAAVRGEEE